MLWACILLPQLALDAVLRRTPDPSKPLALVSGSAQLRSLHAVNAAAAEAGLKPGMRLVAAHALVSDLALVEHDAQADMRWQRFLAAWAYRHSSLVSAQSPGAIVLEARASFRLFGPWPRFEARLREELGALGFGHRIALAPTPRAARVFAGLRDGFAVMQPDAMRQALAQVPVRRAQLPGDAGERLHRMGVRTLGAVDALPRDGLRRRFGIELLQHLDRMRGDADDPLDCYAPPDHFDARIELGYEVESHQALLFPLRRLVGDLATYLSVRDGGVQRFVLRLEHEDGHSDVPVGLLSAEREAALLFELTRNRLEQAALPKPVVGMRLLARELPPFVPASRDLFDTRPEQAVPWPQLRERLRARLGDGAVYRVAISPDPRPEHGWRKLQGEAATSNESATFPSPSSPRRRGPSDFDLRRPEAHHSPRLQDGKLPDWSGHEGKKTLGPRLRGDDDQGRCAGDQRDALRPAQDEQIDGSRDRGSMPSRPTWLLPRPMLLRDPQPRILSGPERLESGWWDGGDARRDYYVLKTSLGQRAWAYAPVGEQGSWMLHGWFA